MAQTVVIDITARFTDETSRGLGKAKQSSDKLGDSLRRTQQQADKLGRSKSELSLKDKATQVIEKVNKSLKSITSKAWNLTVKILDKATAPIRGIFNLLKNPIVQAGAILGIGVGVKDTFDTYTGFEKSMSNVKALTGASDAEMGILTTKAREEGRTTTKSASEAADAMGYMALAGWDKDTILKTIHPTLRLSEAGDMELGRTSDLVTDSMSSLGLKPEQLEGYLDKVAKASSKSNTDIDKLMESFLEIGGTVKQNNIPLEEATGLIGVLANRGVKGSEAGVALNSVLMNLSTGAGQAGKAMKGLGLSAFNSDGSFKGYAQTLKELNDKTKDMTDEQKSYYLGAIGGKMRLADLQKLLSGVSEEYDQLKDNIIDSKGALEEMARTKNDNIYGDMKALQSAVDDVKIGLMTKLQPDIRKFIQWITGKIPDVTKAVDKASDLFLEKVDNMKKKIQDFTSTSKWKESDFFGKVSISWDNLIAEPFGQWWDSKGKPFFSDKANGIGEGIGSGITNGLLVLMGFDVQGAAEDGISIGTSFAKGFSKGFDGKKIGEAFLNAIKGVFKDAETLLPWGEKASGTSGLSAAILSIAGVKIAKTGYGMYKGGASVLGKFKGNSSNDTINSMIGKTLNTATMKVSSNIVNVYGKIVNSGNKIANTATKVGTTAAGHVAGGVAAKAITSEAGKAILTSSGSQALLTGATSGSANVAFTSLANGATVAGTGGVVTQGLATVGTSLGSGASTIGGAVAVGSSSIAGAIGGIVGILSGAWDIFKGTQTEGKESKDKYVQGGTKIGMVGAGAAAGAGIGAIFGGVGAVPGALIGAGVGGVGAVLEGSKVGSWISDSTDEGGTLYNFWQDIKSWSSDTWDTIKEKSSQAGEWISNKWNSLGDWFDNNVWTPIKSSVDSLKQDISEKFNTAKEVLKGKWADISSWFNENIWTPISDTAISAINISVGIWEIGKEKIKNKWSEISGWFGDNVWQPICNTVESLKEFISDKWNDAKNYIKDKWIDLSSWFNDSIWSPICNNVELVKTTIIQRWVEAKDWITSKWTDLSSWFGENIWNPICDNLEVAKQVIIEKWDIAKDFIVEKWTDLSSWFNNNIWTPIETSVEATKNWISMKFSEAKELLQNAWTGVSSWFNDNVWNPISNAATNVWNSIQEKWQNAKDWLTNIGNIGSEKTGLKTSEGKATVLEHATGGFITKPHIGLIGEAGPEVIIPLSGVNKEYGINLWQQTGELLGMIPKHAQGGIFGNTENLKNTSNNRNIIYTMLDDLRSNSESKDNESKNTVQNNNPITISLGGINFTFNGAGTMDKDNIMQIIKEQIPEIADDVAQAIADKLKKLFPNMKAGLI